MLILQQQKQFYSMSESKTGFYSGGLRQSQVRQITDPTYLKSNIFLEELSNHKYSYFLAEKLNNSQLIYNQRFFMLTDNTHFGYASKFQLRPIPFMQQQKLYKLKRNIPIEDLTFVKDKDQLILTVKYIEKDTNKKMNWKIRFQTEKMCQEVSGMLLEAQKNRIQQIHNPKPKTQSMNRVSVLSNYTVSPFFANMVEDQNANKDSKQQKAPTSQIVDQNKTKLQNQMDHIKVSLLGIEKNADQEDPNPQRFPSYKKKLQIDLQRSATKQRLYQSLMNKPSKFHESNSHLKMPHYKYNYDFLKQGGQYRVISEFKNEVKGTVQTIIDELVLFSSRRMYRPSQVLQEQGMWIYEIGGLTIKIGLCQITLNKQTRIKKFKAGGMSAIIQQFKNYDYLLQITRNKGIIRVPMACLVCYKGFVSLVQANIEGSPAQLPQIQKQLQALSLQSQIHPSIFKDSQNVEITRNDSTKFDEFSNNSDSEASNHFYHSLPEIYYITKAKHFLPKDVRYIKFPKNQLYNKLLRPELIQKQEYKDKLFIGDDASKYQSLITETKPFDGQRAPLSEASNDILNIAKQLSEELQTLNDVPISTFDLEDLFHQRGINMRYVWMIHQSSTVTFIRKLCHTYAMIKTICFLLSCKFQELIRFWMELAPFKQQPDQQIHQSNLVLGSTAAAFINSLIGSQKHEQIDVQNMKLLNSHMLDLYGIKFTKNQILPGFLVQGINDQSGLNIRWPEDRPRNYIMKQDVLDVDSVQRIEAKVRTYSLQYTGLYRQIQSIVNQKQEDNIDRLQNLLGLRVNGIPLHLKNSKLYNKLLEYTSIYIRPLGLNSQVRMPPSSSVYTLVNEMWNQAALIVKISEIKWMLMQSTEEKASQLLNKLLIILRKRCEENHPIEGEIYNLLCQYYLDKNNISQAERFALKSLQVWSCIVTPYHIKIGQANYQLGQVYQKASKFHQALKHYKLVQNILQSKSQSIRDNNYPDLLLKISKLQLKLGHHKDSIQTARQASDTYAKLSTNQNEFQTQKIECYQTLAELYMITRSFEDCRKVAFYCSYNLEGLRQDQNFINSIKIITSVLFYDLQKSTSQKVLALISELNSKVPSTSQCIFYLNSFIQQSDLFQSLEGYLKNFEEMYVYINNNNLTRKWNGLRGGYHEGDLMDFINLLVAIMGVINSSYIVGILSQKTKRVQKK